MGIGKGKPDGGQGGKLGHSNQEHWEYTEEVKEAARKRRRLQAKKEIANGLGEREPARACVVHPAPVTKHKVQNTKHF
jgi:hypothetical protein